MTTQPLFVQFIFMIATSFNTLCDSHIVFRTFT